VADVGAVERALGQLLELREVLVSALLEGLCSALMPSFCTSSAACLFTPVWSVIMRSAKSLTSFDFARSFARFPASMSTWFAVTTIPAIC